MRIKAKKPALINIPLTAMKFLYKGDRGEKAVFEIDVPALKQVNEPLTIDEMVAEARLERALGKTKSFVSADELIKELHS